MSKVYDNLRKPAKDPSATKRTRDDSVNDLDLFSFAESLKAREQQKQAQEPEKPRPAAPPPPPAPPAPEEPLFHPSVAAPAEPPKVYRAPASNSYQRKPSLNIFSEEAANAGVEQETANPIFVSRWIWGGLAVLIVLLLPFLIFKKRDTEPAATEEFLPEPVPREVVETPPPVIAPEPVAIQKPVVLPKPLPAPPVSAPKPTVAAPVAPASGAPASEIAGVLLRKEGHDTVIVFKEGVFASGAQLAPQSRELLPRVAQWIATQAPGSKVQIIGCTDNETVRPNSPYKSNRELGMLRAQAVEKFLRGRGELRGVTLSVSSRGEKDAPYPNDSRENRKKNRTVVVRISPP